MKNNKATEINTIIFDLGNVLINFDHLIAVKKLTKYSTLTPGEMIKKISRSRTKLLYEKGRVGDRVFVNSLMKELGLSMDRRKFIAIWSDIFWQNTGMEKLFLKLIKAGYRTAILSDTSPIHNKYELNKFGIIKKAHKNKNKTA